MKSIRLKIWLSILGVTAVVIVGIWIFQVAFLEQFYLRDKKQEIIDDTREMTRIINEDSSLTSLQDLYTLFAPVAVEGSIYGYLNGSVELEQTASDLISIGYSNNYYILITDARGSSPLALDSIGGNCVLRNNVQGRMRVIGNLFAEREPYYLQDGFSSDNNRFYIGASYQEAGSFPYIIMVESALAPVNEAVGTIKNQLIYISIGLILLATLAAFLLARSLTKPILQISDAAKEIAKGNLNVQVHVRSKDEIGTLSEDFNLMSKEIARASTLQRELIANVSHDIRTPLTMIKGYAETIKDLTGDNPPKRNEQLDVIIAESNRLNVLVNDILDLSKLQTEQQPLTYTHFDLSIKLRDILRRYHLLEESEQFQFSLSAPKELWVYADEVKIEQVLYNIINNATNHTGADKRVMISLTETESHAMVRITDTGAGIKEEDLPLIWDRYYKPYKKNDRKGMGTGLGLSIVKAILIAHKVNFGIDSKLQYGSTFWFEVPKSSSAPIALPLNPEEN